MDKKYEIVPLGVNCLPRTILTRWGIKPNKASGELTCPFDLVYHQLDRVIYYIENDFKGYFDDIFFVQRKKKHLLDFKKKGLWQKTDGTFFFHDLDCCLVDKEKLYERIRRRIENFRNIISSERPILFVVVIYNNENIISDLYEALKKVRGTKKFELAAICFGCDKISIPAHIHKLDIPKPWKDYDKTWNVKEIVNTEKSIYAERCICYFIKKVLNECFDANIDMETEKRNYQTNRQMGF